MPCDTAVLPAGPAPRPLAVVVAAAAADDHQEDQHRAEREGDEPADHEDGRPPAPIAVSPTPRQRWRATSAAATSRPSGTATMATVRAPLRGHPGRGRSPVPSISRLRDPPLERFAPDRRASREVVRLAHEGRR